MKYQLSDEQIAWAQAHAEKMTAGASTRSFKSDTAQNTEVYFIGKVGELAVYQYFVTREFDIVHVPFRASYEKFNWNDDFQLKFGDRIRQIEVRTKARNTLTVAPEFQCCTDVIKPALYYVFVNYSRADNTAGILGWADWQVWKAHGIETRAGTQNDNFTHKTNEFNVQVKHLKALRDFGVGFW